MYMYIVFVWNVLNSIYLFMKSFFCLPYKKEYILVFNYQNRKMLERNKKANNYVVN